MKWRWQGLCFKYAPGFEARFNSKKRYARLVCKDNFGREMWKWKSSVKVPERKPSEKKLRELASSVYSEYMQR